jgi:hypothetical protein
MKNRKRIAPALPVDPNGWIVSEDYGDNLYHYDTFERAVQGARDSITEGAKAADVWHAVSAHSTDIDYDQGIEWSARPAA